MSSVSRRIQLRRDTADNWTAINPILAEGEIGYETTGFKRMKVGDGKNRWAALSYFNIGPTGRLGTTGPIGPAGIAANTGATGPTGVPGLSSGVTFQLNHTSAGPITYSTVVSTLAGSSQGLDNQPGTAAKFSNPSGTAVDSSGTVYVADSANHVIRKITSAGVVTTFAGDGLSGSKDGTGSGAQFNTPSAIVINSSGTLFVSDSGNHCIRKITSAGVVSTFAGGSSGFADGIGSNAQFNSPQGIVVDSLGNVFVADSGNHRIRSITAAGQVSTLAGQSTSGTTDDSGTSARFNTPTGIAIDSLRNLYVTDKNGHRIRKVTAQGGVSTLAGSTSGFTNDTGTAAQFNSPVGIAVDSTGTLYVADTGNHRIRTVSSTGVVTTFVGLSNSGTSNGSPSQAQFNSPYSITVGTTGVFYVADYSNHRIRKIVVTASDPNEYVFTPFIGTLITPLNIIPTTSSYIVVPERSTNTHVATFTIARMSMPSTTSIVGQWTLGLNSSVALSTSPGSFYFEVLDGTSSVAVGQATPVGQTSSGVILSTLIVPARTYTTNLTLKLFATTRDLSPLTFRFNGTTLSYLNTTIINVGPTGATGPHLFTIFNKLDHRVITSITDKSDELFANSNLTFNGSNLNVVNTVTTSNFRGQGTVSAPPYAFTTDVTSGMFLPAVSNLALATNATERVRILPSGNVGIATPTPGFTLDVSGTANVSGNLSVGTISTSGGGFSVPGNLTGGIIRTSSNGTAAVPAYTFSNDLSSGMFIPFPNNLAWATAGNERMRISATGRVGIGNQDPLTTLDVTGTARITSTLSAGATTVTSLNAGSGAITTTGSLSTGDATVTSLNAGSGAITTTGAVSGGATTVTSLAAGSGNITTTGSLSTGAATVTSLNAGTGTITTTGILTTGSANVSSLDAGTGNITTTGNIFVNRLVSSGYGSAAQPVIGFEESTIKDGIFRPGAGSLGFSTAGNERMRISGTGRVGIGNQDPLTTLDVTGSARITSTLSAGGTTVTSLNATSGAITTTGALSAGSLDAGSGAITTTGTASVNRLIGGGVSYSTAALPTFGFEEFIGGNYVYDGIFKPSRGALGISAFGVERMRVTSNGVGIGRTDPSNALDVSGTVRITSALTAASASITDVSLNTINGSKYFAGGASGRTFQLNYSSGVAGLTVTTFKSGFIATYWSIMITVDSAGFVYVADNWRIQKITSDGATTTFLAGSTTQSGGGGNNDGDATTARFATIRGMTTDSSGNVYALDGMTGERIRKITPSGDATTITSSLSGNTFGITIDSSGNLYTVSNNSHTIQKTTPLGVVSTFAGNGSYGYGNGSGAQVQFNAPSGIVIDSAGNLYVADTTNHRIRKVTSSGIASLVAGSGVQGNSDGIGALATFNYPARLSINSTGTTLYVISSSSVRKIVIATGEVTTVAGSTTSGSANGVGANASFFIPNSITVASNEDIYVADGGNGATAGRIRKLTSKSESTYDSTTLTGGTLSTEFDPRTAMASITVPGGKTNAKVVSFSIPARYPSMSSITGQWILGLYATVGVPASPARFYFEIMDGSTSVATGSSGTLVNLSTPLQLYTYGLLIPARTYSSSVVLNLYVTTQASSSLTLEFSGSTISYLNTTIQPYGDVVIANDYQIRTSIGILKLLSMSVLAITDNSNNVYTPLCYSLAGRDLKNSFANYQLAPGCRFIVYTGGTTNLDVTNTGTEWTFTAASITVSAGTMYKLYLTVV